MVKLVVLYAPPEDPNAFDDYYFGTHTPLAEKIPGLRRLEVAKLAGLDGATSPYYLQAELAFDDAGALEQGLSSPEGTAAGRDVAHFASAGVTMLVADVVREG